MNKRPFWLRWFGVILFGVFAGLSMLVFMPAGSILGDLGHAAGFIALGLLSLAGLNVWQHFEGAWDTAEMARVQIKAGDHLKLTARGTIPVKMPLPQVKGGISDGRREH